MREFTERPLEPGDLFALRYVHDAQFSPEGRRIAYVTSRTREATAEELFDITILEMDSGARWDVECADSAVYPRWAPDGRGLLFVGRSGVETHLYLLDLVTRKVSALTRERCAIEGAPVWSPNGQSVAYSVATPDSSKVSNRIQRRVFRAEEIGNVQDRKISIRILDVASGADQPLSPPCAVATRPSFSPCGKRLLFFGSDAVGADQALVGGACLFVLDLGTGECVQVLDARWFVAAAAWTACAQRIVFSGAHDSPLIVPKADLWIVGRDGSGLECRSPGVDGNVGFRVHHDMPTWATSQDNMLCVVGTTHAYVSILNGGCTELCRFSLDGEPTSETLASGQRSCLIMDVSRDNSRILFCSSDLHTPWDLHLLDLNTAGETKLTDLNAAVLADWPRMRVEHLRFNSADGRPLEGWHLARADRAGSRPCVLFIHGGPMLATGHAFRFDFHLLAANGYGVVFSNFRGSSGYGEAFMRALSGHWGERGFPDHMAAIDAAIERGLADAERAGVWGPSHGGFATCWIVGNTKRFRAAVAEAAATNFSTMYYLSDAPDLWAKELGGRPEQIPDIYRSRSPLTYAHECRTPTLMLHGEQDLRCPIAEAEQFYRALHDAGCVTELVRIQNMTHLGDSIGPLPVRKAQNEALLDWFERYL